MRLRVKLLSIYGTVILGGTAVALVVVESVARRALHRGAEERLRHVAELLAEHGEWEIGVELSKLESWANMPMVVELARDEQNPNRVQAFQEYFHEVVQRERRHSFYLLNREGECIASDDPRRIGAPAAREVVSKTDSARRAYAGETSIGISRFSTTTARPLVPISAPVLLNGEVVAILRTAVDMDLMREQLFERVRIGKKGRVYIDDPTLDKSLPEGHELLTPDLHPPWEPLPETVQLAMRNAPDGIYEDDEFIFASARMNSLPWVVRAEMPLSEVLAPARWLERTVLGIVAALFGVLITATLLLIAPVVRGIEKCRSFAGELEAGKLDERIRIQSSDEIGELAHGLNAMAAGLQDARKMERLLQDARRQALRYQIDPHFVFNVLTSIDALSREAPEKLPDLTRRIATYLRFTLRTREEMSPVPLRDEIEALRAYLGIEKVRFEEQLEVSFDIDDSLLELVIPDLMLQPLVENAIKYGMQTSPMPLRIQIRARKEAGENCFEVRNSGRWVEQPEREGIGLSNLRKRLELLYGPDAKLTTEESDGWVCSRILINHEIHEPHEKET